MRPSMVHINHTLMFVSELVNKRVQQHPEHADAFTQFLSRIDQSRADLRERIYDTEPSLQERYDGPNALS